MSAPTHRRPRRASIAAAAGALPLAAAALIAPALPATAASPASLAIYDAPGWLNDTITRPTSGCGTFLINGAPRSQTGRVPVFLDYPGTDKSTVSASCDGAPYTFSFETKQGFQAIAAAQEPKLTDLPGTGEDKLTLTYLPGVVWTVTVGVTASDYHPSWFGTAKSKDVVLAPGTTTFSVSAAPTEGFSFFKAGALTPVASGWDFTANSGPSKLAIPATSAPTFTDGIGTTTDSVTLTKVDNVRWTVKRAGTTETTKSPTDFGTAKTLTLKLADLHATAPSSPAITVEATSTDPTKHVVVKADRTTEPNVTAPYGLTFTYQPDQQDLSTGMVVAEDNPGTAKDAVVIASPSIGVTWTVTDNGVSKDFTAAAGKTLRVPVTSRTVTVTAASVNPADYTVAPPVGGFTTTFTDPNIDLTSAAVAPVITNTTTARTVSIQGVDDVTYTINGNTVTAASGTRKTFTVPGTGQIIVVAKSKVGFPIRNANGADGSYTWVTAPA